MAGALAGAVTAADPVPQMLFVEAWRMLRTAVADLMLFIDHRQAQAVDVTSGGERIQHPSTGVLLPPAEGAVVDVDFEEIQGLAELQLVEVSQSKSHEPS